MSEPDHATTEAQDSETDQQATPAPRARTGDLPIEPGDVVLDLAQGRPMQVQAKAADRADEWVEREGYALLENYGNTRFYATESDTVWTCVYVGSARNEPSDVYDFPEARLLRIETERAHGDRVQDEVRFDLLSDLFDVMLERGDKGDVKFLRIVGESVANAEIVNRAHEYAQAGRFGADSEDP